MKIKGRFVDIFRREIYPAIVDVENGIIKAVERSHENADVFILPGLIDSHVHIESSMVTPGAFSLTAVRHGTIGAVSDPHEIANVMGIDGVNYMMEDAGKVPFYFWFGAPSCVPATSFESAGGSVNANDIEVLLRDSRIKYLSEMMNYPGVIYDDKEVLAKINHAARAGKPVDGHAPGLSRESLRKYCQAGISTDHECSTLDEALEKILYGMKVLIREGSAARNLDSLKDLYRMHPEKVMLCSDDIHPEMLVRRHINKLVARLITEGYDLFDIIRSCTVNPVLHYKLECGLLREGDPADFIIVEDLATMNVLETWIKGVKVFSDGNASFTYSKGEAVNNFRSDFISQEDIRVRNEHRKLKIIQAFDGELLTKSVLKEVPAGDFVVADPGSDILKIVVKDRYKNANPAVGFITGFGLKKGAFASSVAHDSHNIICVGADDSSIVECINEIIRMKGGLAVSDGNRLTSLKLNIGGIMSDESCEAVAEKYESLSVMVRELGSSLAAPFMTLSFMALLVIPDLKISDRGLFDCTRFSLVPLFGE
ncbi:MAG: adenine deaminase [Bacteroidales bacterium]